MRRVNYGSGSIDKIWSATRRIYASIGRSATHWARRLDHIAESLAICGREERLEEGSFRG